MTSIRTCSLALIFIAASSMSAFAQGSRETSVAVGGGVINYDLSGVGTAPAFTGRVTRKLGSNLVVEGSLLYARLDQQFGPSTLLAPEGQLQYHFLTGRFRPYVGAGIGVTRESADLIETNWTPTMSFAGGSRVSLNDRVSLFGELRVRGYEWRFTGTMTDITGGLVFRR